ARLHSVCSYSDVAELLLGEGFANAVQHGGDPDDSVIEFRFALTDGLLRVEVLDAGSGRPSLRSVSVRDGGGGVLFLVNERSVRCGCCAGVGGIGKFLWARIAPTAALAAGQEGPPCDGPSPPGT
ncbi:hypothetical protein VM98_34275, partial [Streptomyces rubellomurinus subsp. indigoferus]